MQSDDPVNNWNERNANPNDPELAPNEPWRIQNAVAPRPNQALNYTLEKLGWRPDLGLPVDITVHYILEY